MNHSPIRSWTLPLCSACALALASAGAQPLPQSSTLAGEEAEALLEQRRQAVRERNKDDALIRQALDIIDNPEAIVGEYPGLSNDEAVAKASERLGKTIREMVETSKTRSDHSLAQLLEGDTLVQNNLRATMQEVDEAELPVRYQLYVSQLMGESALKTALALAAAPPDMVMVFRGLILISVIN